MRIAVIGVGYVGLVSAAGFAEFGVPVVAVDRDAARIEGLQQGRMPLFEPGLADLVARGTRAGRLTFTTDLDKAVAEADIVFIAVGTPSRPGEDRADLTFVLDAARDIAKALQGYTVIVTKSTVPVGTGRVIEDLIRTARPEATFDVCSNPEFLREGSAIGDFLRPDRVILGSASERATSVLRALYRPLYLIETPIVVTDRETAELTKYAANAFLAMKVAFINEMADVCENVGADIQAVAHGLGLDRRIGPKFLHASPGFGGSCFPKDTRALRQGAREAGAPSRLVEAVVTSNEVRKHGMAGRVVRALGGSASGKTVALLGLTFKPNTDDVRESVSLDLVPALATEGAALRLYDPEGMDAAKTVLPPLPSLTWCRDAYDAATGADAVVILTEWNEFRALHLARLKDAMRQPVLVDLRDIYLPAEARAAGFRYVSLGRP